MFGTSWRVARIAGVEVRIDSSWAVIALLITYSMYLRLATLYPELSGRGAVGLAIVSAVLFFGSVLVHELAHALVSQARGIRVQDITLFLFGGATRARVESRGPGDEFLIAVVGPLTSAILAGLFGIVAGLGRRGGLAAGRGPGRRHLVRLHRVVPGPGRPRLLPGAAAAGPAARGGGRGRDGRRPAADPAGAFPAGRRGRLLHALRPRRVPGRGAGADHRPADAAGRPAGAQGAVVHPPGAGPHGPARRAGRGGTARPDGRRARQAPGRRGRAGAGGPRWRGGGGHHPIGPGPVAAPLACAGRQGT